jgi:oxygen-independent coproporphyrinogen III oxidase
MTPAETLEALLSRPIFDAYLYSYPHKTAYRPLPPLPLAELWRAERREALSLYIHVPFCEARCGYCNLFSRAGVPPEQIAAYLAALRRQAEAVVEAIAPARFARFAIGGGTPTVLSLDQLRSLLDLAEETLGAEIARIPTSVEISPAAVERTQLELLCARGVSRISVGVQSFVAEELRALRRSQRPDDVRRVLATIRELGFPTLNIDLIYGIEGQTIEGWSESLRAALELAPEELYLYPLYVRPLTPLGRSGWRWDDQRLRLYRHGRDLLLDAGYRQTSMRMFRSARAPAAGGPIYRCQEDGMIGLGCGARSYTERLHYSLEYAVGDDDVRAILRGYVERSAAELRHADYGIRLDDEDQRRRFVILSLLSSEGLALDAYRRRFDADARGELPQLDELVRGELARLEGERLSLTPAGIERSDAIGPWLRSSRVERLMRDYRQR